MNLSGNKIKDLEELKPLENFKELEVLDLFNNEATSIDSYRQKIFAMIPSLLYLDGFDVNDVEAVSDGDDEEDINGNDSDEEDVDGRHFIIFFSLPVLSHSSNHSFQNSSLTMDIDCVFSFGA